MSTRKHDVEADAADRDAGDALRHIGRVLREEAAAINPRYPYLAARLSAAAEAALRLAQEPHR